MCFLLFLFNRSKGLRLPQLSFSPRLHQACERRRQALALPHHFAKFRSMPLVACRTYLTKLSDNDMITTGKSSSARAKRITTSIMCARFMRKAINRNGIRPRFTKIHITPRRRAGKTNEQHNISDRRQTIGKSGSEFQGMYVPKLRHPSEKRG